VNIENTVQVVWFKRDLRVSDHLPLLEATSRGPVLPIYIIEDSVWHAPDADALHWDFVRESLIDLRSSLRQLGTSLCIRRGEVTQVFDDVNRELHDQGLQIGSIWSHQETGNDITFRRDLAVAAWSQQHSIPWREIKQQAVVRGLKDRDDWQKHWLDFMQIQAFEAPSAIQGIAGFKGVAGGNGVEVSGESDVPTSAQLGIERLAPAALSGGQDVIHQQGGETVGSALLHEFLNARGHQYHKEMSSPLTAETSCSRISPYLAWGCLSIRQVVQETETAISSLRNAAWSSSEGVKFAPRALSSFKSRLHWHCHFIQKLESEPEIEFHCFNRSCDDLRGDPNPTFLECWQNGQTGYPYVDACMRALQTWGWINFRMRAMLVSFAAYHLWLDWRCFHPFLARQFRDYEPGIHLPQLQMQSGVTGINTLRIYNPIKQGRDHDPEGVFIRRWVPELAHIVDDRIHEPWTDPSLDVGAYPKPLVEHLPAVRAAKAAFSELRKQDPYWVESQRVLKEHGSRASRGRPKRPKQQKKNTGRKQKADSKTSHTQQLELPF